MASEQLGASSAAAATAPRASTSPTTGEPQPPLRTNGIGVAHFERALRYPSQTLLVLRFSGGLIVALAALVALGYTIGHGPSGKSGSLLHALTKAAALTGVSTALAVPFLLLAGWCLRRLWLQYIAWSPGTIQVPEFQCAEGVQEVAPAQLTTKFRNVLATLRLQTAAPAPGAPPPSDFLDVLSRDSVLDGPASTSSIAQVASLLRAVFPPSALEVRGTLLTRTDEKKQMYGVSLQVTRLPNQGSLLADVWDTSWERAITRAAQGAIAAILPRTRRCKGPWETWRGYVMPPAVFSAYEDASHLDSERCYYLALQSCYRALELDPLNRALRLQLGKLQEQLGLYLQALGTYRSILVAALPAGRRLPRRLYTRRARRERGRQANIASYRLVVLLSGRSIVEQWSSVQKRSPEDPYRQEMERLLLEVCRPPQALGMCNDDQLAIALCESATDEAAKLKWALRRWRLRHPERNPHLLTRTVAVTGACIAERLEALKRTSGHEPAPTIEALLETMDKSLRGCGRWTGLRTFQSHYNAACLYALPLNDEYQSESRADRNARGRLAARAVQQLKIAASFADSAFLASRKDWLVCEDPDLTGLREEEEFTRFVTTYFPAPALAQHRCASPQELRERYTYELLGSIAKLRATTWKQRRDDLPSKPTGPALASWWRDEGMLWPLIAGIVGDPTDWKAHLALMEARTAWRGDPLEFEEPHFGQFGDESQESERVGTRLESLHTLLRKDSADALNPPPGTVDPLPAWVAANERSLSPHYFEGSCNGRKRVWKRVDEYLSSDPPGESERLEALLRSIAELRDHELSLMG
jgi:hypothetical protein